MLILASKSLPFFAEAKAFLPFSFASLQYANGSICAFLYASENVAPCCTKPIVLIGSAITFS